MGVGGWGTGYMGSADTLETIVKVATKLKQRNPGLIYVCDPVLGDNGKLYVPEGEAATQHHHTTSTPPEQPA